MVLLDFIRYQQQLSGTKIGCNEGDCGACTVLIGEWTDDALRYRSATSCLTPLGNAHGKHIVTIEGINAAEAGPASGVGPASAGMPLNPIQQAMCDESATQCGFCTPGFTVSLAGFCVSDAAPSLPNAIAAIDGNICRCTGYKSIARAAARVADLLQNRQEQDPVAFAVDNKLLPGWFAGIGKRLQPLQHSPNGHGLAESGTTRIVGGGTDLYVQKHDEMHDAAIDFFVNRPGLKSITQEGSRCSIGGAATVTDLQESPIIQQHFPQLAKYIKLVSSTPIRNIATIAGNFINASPIGDFTIFFLALDAMLVLNDGAATRELPLRRLYKGYKTLDTKPGEHIASFWFTLPGPHSRFHFEKVSKRTHLDIASVNTALHIVTDGGGANAPIRDAHLSAGGVGPIPKYLEGVSAFLQGRIPDEETIRQAIALAQTEISPISDARGSEAYKRLLLGQLIKAHFITLFPELEKTALLT
jgi:xanthine dehydrogenase small subunit